MRFNKLHVMKVLITGSFPVMSLTFNPLALRSEEFVDEYSKIVPFSEGGKVVVETYGGSVTFSGMDRTDVKIEATRTVQAKNADEAQKIFSKFAIGVKKSPGKLKIETSCPSEGGFFSKLFGVYKYKDIQVDYRIMVPRRADIYIDGTSTDVLGNGVEGTVSLDLTSGDVDIEEIDGRVYVDGTSGDIKVANLGGDLIVDNTSGDVTATRVYGGIEIDKTSGIVDLEEIGEDFYIDATSCDVEISHLAGSAEIDMTSGDVRILDLGGGIVHEGTSGDVEIKFEGIIDKPCRLSTTSGDVSLIITQLSGLDLNLKTDSGGISAKLPQMEIIEISNNNLKATVANGGVEVNVETTSGDINVSQN